MVGHLRVKTPAPSLKKKKRIVAVGRLPNCKLGKTLPVDMIIQKVFVTSGDSFPNLISTPAYVDRISSFPTF